MAKLVGGKELSKGRKRNSNNQQSNETKMMKKAIARAVIDEAADALAIRYDNDPVKARELLIESVLLLEDDL